MFSLFTHPAPSREATPGDHSLVRPLRSASEATGVPFEYLMQTAKRESNLDPKAEAANSSATGLFQFIEQTWLGLIKREGGQLGLAAEAGAIQQDRSGRYVVSEPETRRQILEMRKDPALSSMLAGIFTRENKDSLREALGRNPSAGELYVAHFMGAGGARELISQASSQPEGIAAKHFPDAASANRPIFYDGKGRARSNREVYAQLVSLHGGAAPVFSASVDASIPPEEAPSRSPLAIAAPHSAGDLPDKTMTLPRPSGQGENAFHGLFRSGGQGSSATALRQTWAGFAESRLNRDAPAFFPRDNTAQLAALSPEFVQGSVADVSPSASSLYPLVDAPLPPILVRDTGMDAGVARDKPFDLLTFLKNKR